jgi:hypothetical protein
MISRLGRVHAGIGLSALVRAFGTIFLHVFEHGKNYAASPHKGREHFSASTYFFLIFQYNLEL